MSRPMRLALFMRSIISCSIAKKAAPSSCYLPRVWPPFVRYQGATLLSIRRVYKNRKHWSVRSQPLFRGALREDGMRGQSALPAEEPRSASAVRREGQEALGG